MSAHTPGPWECGRYHHVVLPVIDLPPSEGGGWAIAHVYGDNERRADNARLIAAAPAMSLALEMITAGVARIEFECSGQFVEFCFDGIRYSHNGDWNAMLDVIGWDRARAAVTKGAQP